LLATGFNNCVHLLPSKIYLDSPIEVLRKRLNTPKCAVADVEEPTNTTTT